MKEGSEKDVVVEDGEVDAYMDPDNSKEDGPSQKDQVDYLTARLNHVRNEYKVLQMNRAEAEAAGDKDLLGKIAIAFRVNYKVRKWVVQSLRKLGEKVEDRFIPA